MSTFEFNNQFVPQSLVEIDNIGSFAIEASNDEGYYWYLALRTSLGVVTILSVGPVVPDISEVPSGYSCSLSYMQYKEDKIEKLVNTWLNDKYKKLTEAHNVTFQDALDQVVDIPNYLMSQEGEF